MAEESEATEPIEETPITEPVVETTEPITNDFSWLDEIVQVDDKTPEGYKKALSEKLAVEPVKPTQFANEEVEQFNKYVAATNDTDYRVFKQISSLEESITDYEKQIDAIVLAEIVKNPSLKGKESVLRTRFENKFEYMTSEDIENLDSDAKTEYEIQQIELQEKLRESLGLLNEVKGKISNYVAPVIEPTPTFSTEQLEGIKAEAVEESKKFQLVLPKAEVDGEKTKMSETETIEINFDTEMRSFFEESIKSYLTIMPVTDKAKAKEEAMEYAKVMTMVNSLPSQIALAEKRGYEKAIAEIENPSAHARVERENVNSGGGQKKLPLVSA